MWAAHGLAASGPALGGATLGEHAPGTPGLQEEVPAVQREVLVGQGREGLPVDPDLGRAGVDLDPRVRLVVEHVALPDLPRPDHGDRAAPGPDPAAEAAGGRGGGDEVDAEARRRQPAPAPVRRVDLGLGLRDGGVALAEGAPGGIAALDHELRLDAEELGPPEHDVGALPRLERAHPPVHAVGAGGVDRVLGEVLENPRVVVRRALGPHPLHLVRELPGAADDFADAAHSLGVGVDDADRPQVVQHALRPHRRIADAVGDHRPVARDARVHPVHRPHHGVMLGDDVAAVGDGGRRGRADDVADAGDRQDVRGVPAADALHVIGVDGPAGDRGDRLVELAGLVEAVGVHRDLDVEDVGDGERLVDDARIARVVLVHLEAAGARLDLALERVEAV